MTAPGSPPPTSASRASRAERRRHVRRRRIVAISAALLLVIAAVAAAIVLTSDDSSTVTEAKPTTTGATTTVGGPPPAVIATTKVPQLMVYSQPDAASLPVTTLSATSSYGSPRTLLVTEKQGDWLQALLPVKPNGASGWVKASEVTVAESPYAIDISLSQHKLVLTQAGQPILETGVIIGQPAYPTPPGRFYLTDPVNCNKETVPGHPVVSCGSGYGVFAIGISGFSEAQNLTGFGDNQLAIHGMDNPISDLGKEISHGCVRMPNDVILKIAALTPLLGTPVTITA